MARFEVQHFTICDGWVNTWELDGKPQTFSTYGEAAQELTQFLADTQAAFERGDIEAPYTPEEFQIVEVEV